MFLKAINTHGTKSNISEREGKNISAWFFTNHLPPHFSGAGKNDLLLASQYSKDQINITFVAPNYKLDEDKYKNGIPVLRLPSSTNFFSRFYGPFDLLKYLKKNTYPDLIRMRGYSFSRALNCLFLRNFYPNIKIIVQPAMYGGDDPFSLKNKRMGSFVFNQILKSDAIFSMNDSIKKSFIKCNYPQDNIYDVKNPVEINKFFPLDKNKKNMLRKKLGLPLNTKIIITLGILCKRKNQSFITSAFKQYMENVNISNSLLVHVGPTSKDLLKLGRFDAIGRAEDEEKRVEKEVKGWKLADRVLILGNKTKPEEYLQCADIMIHSSIEEGESNAINEAMACSLPVIIPEADVYENQVPENCCVRYEKDNIFDLKNKIQNLINSKEKIEKIGNAAFEHIIKTRSPSVVAISYLNNLYSVYHN